MADPQNNPDEQPRQPGGAPSAPNDVPDDGENVSIFTEFVWFIRENKKWWLIPLVIVFMVLAALIVIGTNPATAPFIYTLF